MKALVVAPICVVPDASAVTARVRREIAGYKAPQRVVIVDAIPRDPVGKILRRELRQPYWADQARAVN